MRSQDEVPATSPGSPQPWLSPSSISKYPLPVHLSGAAPMPAGQPRPLDALSPLPQTRSSRLDRGGLVGMFQPNPEDHLHLRLHRARSVVLTTEELVEVRAAQRTFEGAYMRTALGQFSFALIILKIFTPEFYAIGALFAVYGTAILLVAMYRRHESHQQFFNSPPPAAGQTVGRADGDADAAAAIGAPVDPATASRFRTSGNSVALLTPISLGAYVALMVLTWRLPGE